MTRKRNPRRVSPEVSSVLASLILAALAGKRPGTPALDAIFGKFPDPRRPAPPPAPADHRFDPKTASGARDLGVADVED